MLIQPCGDEVFTVWAVKTGNGTDGILDISTSDAVESENDLGFATLLLRGVR